MDSVSPQSKLLSWTHYRVLLQVEDTDAREWYESEAYNQAWSVKGLDRPVSLDAFLKEPIFDGKTFWECEKEIEWVDY